MIDHKLLTEARVNFIEQLHEAFMAEKGYGAYVYLTPYGAVKLFQQFLEQSCSEKDFIKAYVSNFVRI